MARDPASSGAKGPQRRRLAAEFVGDHLQLPVTDGVYAVAPFARLQPSLLVIDFDCEVGRYRLCGL
jgi:hypothetical protein